MATKTRKHLVNWLRSAAALAVVLLLVAGCGAPDSNNPSSSGPTPSTEASGPSGSADTPGTSKPSGSAKDSGTVQPQKGATVTAQVIRVVDGDTINVLLNGKQEKVRLIGVDTPETVHPSKPVEPYGPEASAFTKRHLSNRTVQLEFDVERRDRYDRLLAYVWLSDEMFNATLLKEGYAQVATFPPNVKYVDQFLALQREAREAERGLWGLDPDASTGSTSSTSSSTGAVATGAAPAAGTFAPDAEGNCVWNGSRYIKGNQNSMIYHPPGGAYYDKTHAEECFATPADAEAAGYRASKR